MIKEEELFEKHLQIVKMGNKTINEYFGEYQIFHDCLIKKILHDYKKCRMVIEIQQDEFKDELRMKKIVFRIEFIDILTITFGKQPIVGEDNYSLLKKKYFFQTRENITLKGCYFDKSDYNQKVASHFKPAPMKAYILFDNGLYLVVDFLEIRVVKPEALKKINIKRLYEKIHLSP